MTESPVATPAQAPRRVLLFSVGGRTYGCDIEVVREIVPFRRPTRLPGAPDYILGLVNLRGTIIPVLHLGLRLAAGAATDVEGSIVLVEDGGRTLGIAVDEVMDVQPLPAERVQQAGAASEDGIVVGVGHLEGDTVVILIEIRTLVRQVLL